MRDTFSHPASMCRDAPTNKALNALVSSSAGWGSGRVMSSDMVHRRTTSYIKRPLISPLRWGFRRRLVSAVFVALCIQYHRRPRRGTTRHKYQPAPEATSDELDQGKNRPSNVVLRQVFHRGLEVLGGVILGKMDQHLHDAVLHYV